MVIESFVILEKYEMKNVWSSLLHFLFVRLKFVTSSIFFFVCDNIAVSLSFVYLHHFHVFDLLLKNPKRESN